MFTIMPIVVFIPRIKVWVKGFRKKKVRSCFPFPFMISGTREVHNALQRVLPRQWNIGTKVFPVYRQKTCFFHRFRNWNDTFDWSFALAVKNRLLTSSPFRINLSLFSTWSLIYPGTYASGKSFLMKNSFHSYWNRNCLASQKNIALSLLKKRF